VKGRRTRHSHPAGFRADAVEKGACKEIRSLQIVRIEHREGENDLCVAREDLRQVFKRGAVQRSKHVVDYLQRFILVPARRGHTVEQGNRFMSPGGAVNPLPVTMSGIARAPSGWRPVHSPQRQDRERLLRECRPMPQVT
jgi:hypothetical protein